MSLTTLQFELEPHILQFEDGSQYPTGRRTKVYQVQDRTAGGQVKVETLGIITHTRTLIFSQMSQTDYEAVVDWFLNVVNAGEKTFTFTDEYGQVFNNARFMMSEIDFNENSLQRHSGSLVIEYEN